MTAVRGVNRSQAKIQADRVRKALVAPQPQRRSSVTEPGDQIRVGAPGAGGTLEAGGPFTWTGPVYLNGDVEVTLTLTVSGSTTIGGTTTIKDSLTIEDSLTVTATTELGGVTTLKNDLNVQAPGKITVEGAIPLVLENGKASFANGSSIEGSAAGIAVSGGGSAFLEISLGSAAMIVGSSAVRVEGTGNVIDGQTDFSDPVILNSLLYAPSINQAPIAGVPSGTLVRDPSTGQVYAAI